MKLSAALLAGAVALGAHGAVTTDVSTWSDHHSDVTVSYWVKNTEHRAERAKVQVWLYLEAGGIGGTTNWIVVPRVDTVTVGAGRTVHRTDHIHWSGNVVGVSTSVMSTRAVK